MHTRERDFLPFPVELAFISAGIMLAVAASCLLAMTSDAVGAETMRASWYHEGKRTANGERYNPDGLTAAHRTIPFGTRLQVCRHGRCVTVRVNDFGPAKWTGRDIDLSRGAARKLGMLHVGVAHVTVERLQQMAVLR